MLVALTLATGLVSCDKWPLRPASTRPASGTPAPSVAGGTSDQSPAGNSAGTTAGPASSGAESPATIQPQAPISLGDAGAQAHEQSALLALGEIKQLLAVKDFEKAKLMASSAVKDYADTMVAREFAPLLQQAQDGAAAAVQERATVSAGPEDVRAQRHAQFVKIRDAGVAAMDKQDAATAATLFQQALQIEEDADVRELLTSATNMSGKPRVCVAMFEVAGDVGIPDAGKAVPELMLSRFDAKRFQLVDRSRVEGVLAEQNLSLAQIMDNPKVLRVKKIGVIRYLVVGSVVRVGHLSVAARLVDVLTGEIVQTAEIGADDAAGLERGLSDLVAMLQMTNDEKASFLAFKQKQADALVGDDAAARAAAEAQQQQALEAERQRIAQAQTAAFAQMQHERDAQAAVADIRALLASGDCFGASRNTRWALQNFRDTQSAKEIADLDAFATARCQEALQQQQNGGDWQRAQADRAAHHQRFVQFRDAGVAALTANDLVAALAALQNALNEEDNPGVRDLLNQINLRMRRPAIAVADFDVRGDIGLPRREAGRSLAAFLLRQFARDDGAFRPVERDEFLAQLTRAGLRMDDVLRDPLQPRMRTLRDSIRFVVVGNARTGPLTVSATMLDLATGQTVQTAEFIATSDRALDRAISDMAAILQMSDAQKADYLNQRAFADLMARGDAASAAARWDEAMDCYRQAYRIGNSPEALDRMTAIARKVEDFKKVRREYDGAMAAGNAAARAGDWDRALDAYRQALAIMSTPEAKAAYDDAFRKVGASAEARRRHYDRAMAEGEAFARSNDWDKAIAAYKQAVEIDPTPAARAALARAERQIADQREGSHRTYLKWMGEAKAAIQSGDWTKALDAFTRAAAIEDSREATNGIATARQKLAEYSKLASEGDAAARAGDWKHALDAYAKAAAISNTPEVQASIANARKRLGDAATASGKLAEYAKFAADGDAAARAGDWKRALDAYTKAAAISNTPEVQASIANARRHVADGAASSSAASEKLAEYNKFAADGDAAARAGDWKRALDAYTKAAAINNTAEVQASIANARKRLADAAAASAAASGKLSDYAKFASEGDTAARAGDWQRALDAYTRAAAISNTAEVQASIANARKRLADAAAASAAASGKMADYAKFASEGDTAARAGDWKRALDAYTKAAAINNSAEVQASIANARKHLADAAAASAAASGKLADYSKFAGEGDTAARAGDWQRALDAYTKAAGISNTAEVQASIANARKHLADAAAASAAAAGKLAEYAKFAGEGDTAARAGDWKRALDAYTKAAAVNNTAEVQASIANARKHLADAAAASAAASGKMAEYAKFAGEGDTAARAGDWKRALDAYTKAAAINNTAEVQASIANARSHLADAANAAAAADKHAQYVKLMSDGDAAGSAGDWNKALDLYTRAAAIENTREVQADIAKAKKKIADAAVPPPVGKKVDYTSLMADGLAAGKANDWQKALDCFTQAQTLNDTPDVRSAIANAKKRLHQ